LLIALAVPIPFLGIAFAAYRVLYRGVAHKKLGAFTACLLFWLVVLGLPWLITWIMVPVSNPIFAAYPALQGPAWDVGLALALFLGMSLSYILGAVAAGIVTWQFISHAKRCRG
jgi:hypothetical protein